MGSGPGEGELRAWAERLPPVRYLGFVPFEEKVRELAGCSVLLSTSASEPYGLTSVEGLASGLPLVATPTAGSSYLVRQDPGFGRVVSYAPGDLARAILSYRAAWASDPVRFRSQRQARRQRARELFDLPRMFRAYDACLADLTRAG
jgi:glycosyltransferase involved in cell wall biosynthesis